ncbi:MAG: hypothetical protein V4671_04930 [Armatimonadota bacterium]
MPNTQNTGNRPHIGVPSEARLRDQRQIENEAVSRRYSTMVPIENIKAQGQFLQKVAHRRWSVGGMLTIWLVVGGSSIALMVAGILSALSRSTPAERTGGTLWACALSGIPLLALTTMTRNWLRQRRFARDLRRPS